MIAALALAAMAVPDVAAKRPASVFMRGDGSLMMRLAAAMRGGIADSPRFRTPRSAHDDDVQFVFTAAPRRLTGVRFRYEVELMMLDGGGSPITVAPLSGICRSDEIVACSSAILAHAAHALDGR